jgi:hypothetical protein
MTRQQLASKNPPHPIRSILSTFYQTLLSYADIKWDQDELWKKINRGLGSQPLYIRLWKVIDCEKLSIMVL